jgi:hypothetical protein
MSFSPCVSSIAGLHEIVTYGKPSVSSAAVADGVVPIGGSPQMLRRTSPAFISRMVWSRRRYTGPVRSRCTTDMRTRIVRMLSTHASLPLSDLTPCVDAV